MERATTRYLVVGDRAYHEFSEGLASLAEDGLVVSASDAETAAKSWPYAASPDWIVLAESHRGRVASSDVEQLRRRFPASRCVALSGSWCEGETRSGSILSDVPRLHWTCFPAQMRWLRQAALEHPHGPGDMHFTAWEKMASLRLAQLAPTSLGVVAIHADSLEVYEALADLCATCGLVATWWRGEPLFHRELKALIWDSPFGDPRDIAQLERAAGRHPRAAAIMVVGFPRGDWSRRGRDAGVRVLPKPLQAADLSAALQTSWGERVVSAPVAKAA